MQNPSPPPKKFSGDPQNRHVSDFLSAMERQDRKQTAHRVVQALVAAGYQPWLCEVILADLTKACTFVPPRSFGGRPQLSVIPGDKS